MIGSPRARIRSIDWANLFGNVVHSGVFPEVLALLVSEQIRNLEMTEVRVLISIFVLFHIRILFHR